MRLILKWYTILEDFFPLDSVHYQWRCHDDIKSLIGPISWSWSQADIGNWHRQVFHLQYISNVMARYQGRFHFDIVTVSKCPLESKLFPTSVFDQLHECSIYSETVIHITGKNHKSKVTIKHPKLRQWRSVFRTHSNNYDGPFLRKYLTAFSH